MMMNRGKDLKSQYQFEESFLDHKECVVLIRSILYKIAVLNWKC